MPVNTEKVDRTKCFLYRWHLFYFTMTGPHTQGIIVSCSDAIHLTNYLCIWLHAVSSPMSWDFTGCWLQTWKPGKSSGFSARSCCKRLNASIRKEHKLSNQSAVWGPAFGEWPHGGSPTCLCLSLTPLSTIIQSKKPRFTGTQHATFN